MGYYPGAHKESDMNEHAHGKKKKKSLRKHPHPRTPCEHKRSYIPEEDPS